MTESIKTAFIFRIHWGVANMVIGAELLDSVFFRYREVCTFASVEWFMEDIVNKDHRLTYYTINPLLLNYLTDVVAAHVIMINDKPFYQYPELMKKLKFMGPGEALADTNFPYIHIEKV